MSPDITMCTGVSCPIRETCYRFKAQPDKYRQSYFVEAPVKPDGSCDYFMQVRR